MSRFGPAWIAVAALAAAAFADDAKTEPKAEPGEAPGADAKAEPAKEAPKPVIGANAGANAGAKNGAAAKAPAREEPPTPPAPQTFAEAMLRLGRLRVDIDFREATLEGAAEFLARVARMNVILSPALRAKGTDALPRIDLKLTRVTLRQFAEILAKQTDTRLVLRDGILQFTTPEDARGKPVLRIYPLADLTMRIRNFPGPDINLHLASVEFEDEKESDVESAFDDPQEIVETLKTMTGADTWDDDDVSISADERKLVVKQYAEVHREIARLLALLRATK